MKKTLFVHPINDYTGSTKVLADIINKEYTHENVKIITRDSCGFLSGVPNIKIIPVYFPKYKGKEIPIITGIIWKLHASLLILFHALFCQTIYINTILPYYAAFIGRIYRKKIIYHIHEYFIIKNRSTRIAEYVFNNIKSERIFVSKYVKKQYIPKNTCKSWVKYNYLPESFTKNIVMRPISERKRNNIIMISSLNKLKGIFMFIEVAQNMPEYNFNLIISQDIKIINSFIEQEISLETIPNNLKIIPAQTNIQPFLEQSDLLLNLTNPSLAIETFGMTILEAMAYGIPSIVPNVGGPIELVENGYNGYTIDVTNRDEIILKIKDILNEKNYNIMANNSLSNFTSKFN